MRIFLNPQLFLSGDRAFVHAYPVYPAEESATFCIRSPKWKFLNPLLICIRKRLLVTANEQHVQQFYQLDLNPDSKLNFLEENQTYIHEAGIISLSPPKS